MIVGGKIGLYNVCSILLVGERKKSIHDPKPGCYFGKVVVEYIHFDGRNIVLNIFSIEELEARIIREGCRARRGEGVCKLL